MAQIISWVDAQKKYPGITYTQWQSSGMGHGAEFDPTTFKEITTSSSSTPTTSTTPTTQAPSSSGSGIVQGLTPIGSMYLITQSRSIPIYEDTKVIMATDSGEYQLQQPDGQIIGITNVDFGYGGSGLNKLSNYSRLVSEANTLRNDNANYTWAVKMGYKGSAEQWKLDGKPEGAYTPPVTQSNMTKDYAYYKALYPDINDTALWGKARLDNPNLGYPDFMATKTTTPSPTQTQTTTPTTTNTTSTTTSTTPKVGDTQTLGSNTFVWNGSDWSLQGATSTPQATSTTPTQTSTTPTTTPTSSGSDTTQDFNTYISAQNNGFTGTFNEWVAQGRPTSAPTNTQTVATTTQTQEVDTTKALQDAYKVIDDALARGEIDSATAQLFKNTVASWDFNKDVNMENVLAKFQEIKAQTIDPYFREQTDVFINDLQDAIGFQTAQRETELEAERKNAGLSIRQAKEGLESAGMTFTGKGVEELGAKSAYAQGETGGVAFVGYVNGQLQGFPSHDAAINAGATGITENTQYSTYGRNGVVGVKDGELTFFSSPEIAQANNASNVQNLSQYSPGTPSQIPFGGLFYEGNVNQANRLISTGTEAAYKEKMQALGRTAENTLGTQASLYNIPGYTPAGVTSGSISQAQQQAYGNTISSLGQQQSQLNAYGNPINPLNQ